ncbi:hypothetical protein VNO78_25907 [Psophocarpus tetragonolobus]|uniref:Helitron helicase-like domain-containing protein n=1 Tax=Psophocarpus tetragonolobus TaxID=3891 RepID=A0AAN9XFE2_PSOTE
MTMRQGQEIGMHPTFQKRNCTTKDVDECSLVIKERPTNQPQYNLPTAPQVAAIIVGRDVESMTHGRDINVVCHDGNLMRIQEPVGYYDPLQYPLLLPLGTYDWDLNTKKHSGKSISCREYYTYTLQIRPNHQSVLLQAGRLLQQYVVDNYVKIEAVRLRWIPTHQNNICVEVYQGLQDTLHVGETTTENVGQRTILPSSFIGIREEHELLSFDEVEGDTHNVYQQEFLHTITPGHHNGKRAFLSRIKHKTTKNARLPFGLLTWDLNASLQ